MLKTSIPRLFYMYSTLLVHIVQYYINSRSLSLYKLRYFKYLYYLYNICFLVKRIISYISHKISADKRCSITEFEKRFK